MTHKSSEYMYWAKTGSKATYNLATSGVIYSRFPPTARSGPSSPSRARLSSSSSGCFLFWPVYEKRTFRYDGISSRMANLRSFRVSDRLSDLPNWFSRGPGDLS